MVGNRRDPKGKGARKEREERLKAFLKAYGGKNEVGPRPFLVGVWTALRLQTVGEEKGGAGGRRVEWEVDDGELELSPSFVSSFFLAFFSSWE